MFTFHYATPDDADAIAEIVAQNSRGIAQHLFGGLVPGIGPNSILTAAFVKGEGPNRVENVICATRNDTIVALLFSYPFYDHKVPPLMEIFVPAKRLNAGRPMLEKSVSDSLYINTLWLAEELHGKGYADALMVEAVSRCRKLGFSRISLFCWNDAERSMRFFARHGFVLAESLANDLIPLESHPGGASILCKTLRGD
jgi:ribosomal protein S18 acetylase RimI-like enzyme